MNVNRTIISECKVSGILCFVLHLSRIFGIAPLKFKRVGDGSRISVSRSYSFYGQSVTIILMSSSITAFIADLTMNIEKSSRTTTNAKIFLWLSDLIIVDLIVFSGTYTGTNRMRHMIDCIANLNHINKELSCHCHLSSSNDAKTWLFIIFYIALAYFVNAMDYIFFIFDVVKINGNVLTSSFYVAHNILCFMLVIFVIQFSVIAMSVLPSLQALNSCLQKIYEDSVEQFMPNLGKIAQINLSNRKVHKPISCVRNWKVHPTKSTSTVTSITLHRLTLIYCSLCDVVRQLNSCNELVLIFLILYFLLHLVMTLYNFIIGLFDVVTYSDYTYASLQLAWVVYILINMIMVIEPCHRTHQQMDLTRILIGRLRQYICPDDFTVASELKIFHRHIMLNQVSYSPMQFFVINRAIVVTIMGSITTYLMIIIQL